MHIKTSTLTKTLLIPALCLGLSIGATSGCKNDEAAPPLPTAKPAPTPSTVTLTVEESEDAGAEEEPKKTGGTGRRPGGALSACCAALTQNAANLPEPSKGHMLTAAAACRAADGSGSPAGAFLGGLTGMLRGAPLPPACR